MPEPKSGTESVERLRLLLEALTSEWQPRDAIIERVGVYPPEHTSAMRMFPRDVRSLLALGFQVERTDGHHDPEWRLVGHERFGSEVRTRFCTRCRQWRIETLFGRDAGEKSGAARYCVYCLREQQRKIKQTKPSRLQWRRKLYERAHRIKPRTSLVWRPVTIGGVGYPSQSAAARARGVSRQAINQRARRKDNDDGEAV